MKAKTISLALAGPLLGILSAIAGAQTRALPLPYGSDGMNIPATPTKISISPRSIELMGESLKAPDQAVRVGHVRELALCGSPALGFLFEVLKDPNPQVRAEAVRSIGVIADASALGKVSACLSDSDARVRREAVLTMVRLGHNDDALAALDDPDVTVKQAAIATATSQPQADRIASAFSVLPMSLRPLALDALGRIGGTSHADVAVQATKSTPAIRTAAARALGLMKANLAHDAVFALLSDPFPAARREAVLAMRGVAAPDEQSAKAIAMLADPDPIVREAAAVVLQSAPAEAAIHPLSQLLADPYDPVHLASRQAMVAIGQPIIPAAVQLLDDSNPRRREDGSFLLGACSSNARLDRHIQLLDDTDLAVCAQAARSLRKLNPNPTVVGPHLLRVFQRTRSMRMDSSVIAAQREALLLAGEVRFAGIIPIAMQSIPRTQLNPGAPDEVRTAAIWTIGVIARPDDPAMSLVRAVVGDPLQSSDAAFEAVKATINCHDPKLVTELENWESDTTGMIDNPSRWMAHFGLDLLQGTQSPFVPIEKLRHVSLSIEDLPK